MARSGLPHSTLTAIPPIFGGHIVRMALRVRYVGVSVLCALGASACARMSIRPKQAMAKAELPSTYRLIRSQGRLVTDGAGSAAKEGGHLGASREKRKRLSMKRSTS